MVCVTHCREVVVERRELFYSSSGKGHFAAGAGKEGY